jgi:hypothetical protein
MTNPLLKVPGLGGFIAGKEQIEREAERRNQQQLQNVSVATTLEEVLRKRAQAQQQQEQEQAFRRDIAALGPEPAQEALSRVAARYADPKSVLENYQRSQDRKEVERARAHQFAQNLELRQQGLDLQREQFNQRTQDAAERAKFDQWYRGESLKLRQASDAMNAELRAMGIEIQRQGRDQAQRDRVDRSVTGFANELQQNKIPALSASITTANDLLKNYEDKDDIPGLGVFTGSKKIPDFLRSEEANKNRSALQAVSNDLLNLYSGLAVTLPESERRELEEMKNGNFDVKDFKNAWPRIVNRYNTVVGNLKAGANAEVLKEYQSRPGAMKLDPLTPAFGGGDPLVMDGYRFPNQQALDAYKRAKGQ